MIKRAMKRYDGLSRDSKSTSKGKGTDSAARDQYEILKRVLVRRFICITLCYIHRRHHIYSYLLYICPLYCV